MVLDNDVVLVRGDVQMDLLKKFFLALPPIVFLPFLFFRDGLFLYDSYAFMSRVCFEPEYYRGIEGFYFEWMPCDFFTVKLFLFFTFLFFYAGLLVLGRCRDEKSYVEAVFLVVSLSPAVLFTFFTFENEPVALAMAVWATVLLLRENKSPYLGQAQRAEGMIILAVSAIVWGGMSYYIVALALMAPITLVLAAYVFLAKWQDFFHNLANPLAIESRILGMMNILFAPIILISLRGSDRRLALATGTMFAFGLLNAKLLILTTPFLVLLAVRFVQWIEPKKNLKTNLFVFSTLLLIGWGVAGVLAQPTQEDWAIVHDTIRVSEERGVRLLNDWSYGHWLIWAGADTDYYGGGKNPFYLHEERPFVALTEARLDCELVRENISWSREVRLYVCN